MLESFRELHDYRFMVRSMVKREVRGRYKGSVLGFLWNFIIPMVQIIVYVAVFTMIFRVELDNYYAYLIAGMVPWIFFSDSLCSASGSIVENSQMINKIYFPRTVIPISVVLSKLVNFAISIGIIFVILMLTGFGLSVNIAMIPIAMLLLLIFTIGASLLMSAIDAYLRDVAYMVNVVLMVLIWLTPIMYAMDGIESGLFNAILTLNPMTYFVELFQDALYWMVIPDLSVLVICGTLALIMFAIGWYVFTRLEVNFSEVL